MPKRSSKKEDVNETAFRVVQESTRDHDEPAPKPAKDPAAVALGRKGGLKGGKARAANLTPEERTRIAKKAAASRWKKPPE
jgi:hypothetical protein